MDRRSVIASLALMLVPAAFGEVLEVVTSDVELVRTSLGISNGYAVYSIDVKGAASTRLDGLAPNGLMAGTYGDSSGTHGLVISGGIAKSFDIAGATVTYALGINPSGEIVGRYDLKGSPVHGYLFTKGQAVTIVYPEAVRGTVPHAISPNGEITGYYLDGSGKMHGFLISKQGTPERTYEPADATTSMASAVNAAGQIAALYYDKLGVPHGFLSSRGHLTGIDVSGASGGTMPFGINSQGEVVGMYTSGTSSHGFLYRGGDCATNCATLDVPGATLTRANGIDPQGDIVGFYIDTQGKMHGYVMLPVDP